MIKAGKGADRESKGLSCSARTKKSRLQQPVLTTRPCIVVPVSLGMRHVTEKTNRANRKDDPFDRFPVRCRDHSMNNIICGFQDFNEDLELSRLY